MRNWTSNIRNISTVTVIFGIVLLGVIWVGLYCKVQSERQLEIDNAIKETATYARMFEEHTIRTLRGLDEITLFLKYQAENDGQGSIDLPRLIKERRFEGQPFLVMGMLNENGDLAASSHVPFVSLNNSDLEYFQAHREADSGKLFIGKPLAGRASGQMAIHLSRRLNKSDGSFGGVVVVAVDPNYFVEFYKQVNLGANSSITLLGSDGIVRVRQVENDIQLGTDLNRRMTEKISASPAGSYLAQGSTDGINRVYSYRALPGYPLLVAVGESEDHIFEDLNQRVGGYYRIAGAMSVVIILFVILLVLGMGQRKKAEAAMRASEERFQLGMEATRDGLWDWDVVTDKCYFSPGYYHMLGYQSGEFPMEQESWISLLHPEDRENALKASLDCVERACNAFEIESRMKAKNGEWRWILGRGKCVAVDETGRAVRIVGTHVDITERKIMEKYQQLSAEVLGILNDPLALFDAINLIHAVIKNETGFDAVGIRLRNGDDFPYFVQSGFTDGFLHSENTLLVCDKEGSLCTDQHGKPTLACLCGQVLMGRTDLRDPLFTANGSAWTNHSSCLLDLSEEEASKINLRGHCIHEGYSSFALIPIRANREIVGLLQLSDRKNDRFTLATIRIFELIGSSIGAAFLRKKSEEALRASQSRYQALMEQSSEALALIDMQTREVLEINRRFTELFGYSLPDDAPLYVNRFVVDSMQNLDRIYQSTLSQQRFMPMAERVFRHKNGTKVHVERTGSVVSVDGRDLYLASMRDMTAERRRQADLSRDVEFARRVQQGLLPVLPDSHCAIIRSLYCPANFVSGDSYHLEWQNDGTLLRGFLIDVSGHGLSTAIQTSSINVLLREAATFKLSLLEQMRLVNKRAAKYFTDDAYAAILGFELDFSLGELNYVGAGITQFYANGKKIETPGMFVGMWVDAEFEAGKITVAAGDSFCFLTDGFTDSLAQPENAGLWSPNGLDFDADVAALERLAENGNLHDDASGVCLKVLRVG